MTAPSPPLDGQVPVRFPEGIAGAARRLADAEGMTLSAWIRREVEREISRREGRCGHCGQAIPQAVASSAEPDAAGTEPPGESDGAPEAATAELKALRAVVAGYENAITWNTSCLSCARVLDESIAEHERAEKRGEVIAELLGWVERLLRFDGSPADDYRMASLRERAGLPPAPDGDGS